MNLKDILQSFSHIAPNLGKVLDLIPGDQIPGTLLSLLGEAFGGTDEASISQAIQADPASAIKLRQIDSDERLATLANKLQENQAAYAAQQETQSFFLALFNRLMTGFGPVKYFLLAFVGWYLLLFSFAFMASIFTNVIITADERWMLAKLTAPFSAIFSLLTVIIPLLFRNK